MRFVAACRSKPAPRLPNAAVLALILLAPVGALAEDADAPDEGPDAATSAEGGERVDLEALLEAFASMPGLEARFVQRKHIEMLSDPLVSRGRLHFAQPGHLARIVEEPRRSRVVITPDELRIEEDEETRTLDLGSRPDVKLFVESFVRLLAGDREALERIYRIEFERRGDDGEGWRLRLVPTTKALRELVTRMVILGEGLHVHELRVREASGNRTVTRFEDVDPTRRYSAEERERLFGDAAK